MSGPHIARWAARFPHRPALISNGSAISYGALLRVVLGMRARLAGEVVAGGAPAAVIVRSLAECWMATTALRSLGVTTVAVRDATSLAGLDLGPLQAICVSEADHREGLEIGGRPGVPVHSIGPLRPMDEPVPEDAASRLAPRADHILYSSGTTGSYKLIAFPHAHEAEIAEARARFYAMDTNTVFNITNFGMWTAVGFKNPIAVWAAGGTLVIDETPSRMTRLASFGVNQVFLVPGGIEELLAARGPDEPRLDHLRVVVSGGMLPMPLAETVVTRLTTRLTNVYTATEINRAVLAAEYAGDVQALRWMAPMGGAEVGIVDDAGRPCPPGREGRLRYRLTERDCPRYLDDPDEAGRIFEDGWFFPGDLAVAREDGRILILGRAEDVIELKGQKRAAGPIEAALSAALGNREVCVFSGLDGAGDARIVVAVETDRPLQEAELKPLAAHFPGHGRITFQSVKAFPRTDNGMGKVQRGRVRAAILQALGGAG